MKKKSFAVIGLGRFGTSVAMTLCAMGHEVLAVDASEARVNDVMNSVTHAVIADASDERALSRLGIRNFDTVIISVGADIRASILATVLCRELGAKYIIAKASDALHAKLLNKTGADKVLQPEYEAGIRLARSLVSESIVDYLDLSNEYSVTESRIPLSWVGHSLIDLNVRSEFGVSVIAIRREGQIHVTLDPRSPFIAGDVIVMIGANVDLERVAKLQV